MRKALMIVLVGASLFFIGSSKRALRASQSEPTFSNQIVRIFQRNCQACHHPGDIAPFSLMNYRDARPWARAIKEAVVMRKMPPWKAKAGCAEFDGERRLSDDDIATISGWVDAGAPEGDPAELPAPLTFEGDWALGAPDVVLQPDEDYTVKPGNDIYRCFTIPTKLRGDRYISAVDIKPGNRTVVHHVIIYLDTTGESKQLDDADPGPGYTSFGGPGFVATGTLGGWAPGARARFEPNGNAWVLPKDARVVIQVHYHPTGEESATDRTQIGLYFARQPVIKDIQVAPIFNTSFTIPAGAPRHRVTALLPVPVNAHLLGIFPHMHLLGREMTVEARSLSGETRCLIDIDDWNFNWQGFYYYKEPVPITPFTVLSLTAHFDNSENNPFNPNSPPKTVQWGEQTTDEMCLAFIEFTIDNLSHTPSTPELTSAAAGPDGKLTINGKGFTAGADILVNGERVRDTLNHKKKKKAEKLLTSKADWKRLAQPGTQVFVSILNTDGVESNKVAFTR